MKDVIRVFVDNRYHYFATRGEAAEFGHKNGLGGMAVCELKGTTTMTGARYNILLSKGKRAS